MSYAHLQIQNGNAGRSLDSPFPQAQAPKQPGTFRRLLGMAAGIAGNMFMPGMGGILGNIIGGGLSGGLNSGLSGGLGSGVPADIAGGADQIATQGNAYLQLLRQVNQEQEKIETVGAVIKSKHDAVMSVIQSIKG